MDRIGEKHLDDLIIHRGWNKIDYLKSACIWYPIRKKGDRPRPKTLWKNDVKKALKRRGLDDLDGLVICRGWKKINYLKGTCIWYSIRKKRG